MLLRQRGILRRICRIFGEVLRRDHIETDLNLFRQGGDSLDAVACAVALEKDYRVDLPLEAFLAHTPAALADNILLAGRPGFHIQIRDLIRGILKSPGGGRR